jgi:hypothetical protein
MAENKLSRREVLASVGKGLGALSLTSLLSDNVEADRKINIRAMPVPRFHIHAAPYPYTSFTHIQWASPTGIVFNSYIPANHFAGGRGGNFRNVNRDSRIFREHQRSTIIPGVKPVITCNYFQDNGDNCSERSEFCGYDSDIVNAGESWFTGLNIDLNKNCGKEASITLSKREGNGWRAITTKGQTIMKHRIPWMPLDTALLEQLEGPGTYAFVGEIRCRDNHGRIITTRVGEDKFRLESTVSANNRLQHKRGTVWEPEDPAKYGIDMFGDYGLFASTGFEDGRGGGIKDGLATLNEFGFINNSTENGIPYSTNDTLFITQYNPKRRESTIIFKITDDDGVQYKSDPLSTKGNMFNWIEFSPNSMEAGDYSFHIEYPDGSCFPKPQKFSVRKYGGDLRPAEPDLVEQLLRDARKSR